MSNVLMADLLTILELYSEAAPSCYVSLFPILIGKTIEISSRLVFKCNVWYRSVHHLLLSNLNVPQNIQADCSFTVQKCNLPCSTNLYFKLIVIIELYWSILSKCYSEEEMHLELLLWLYLSFIFLFLSKLKVNNFSI